MRFVFAALLLAAAPAEAQDLADYDYELLAFRGVGLDYGYMWPNKVGNASAFGARFDLGYLGPGIRIAPSVFYWSSSFTEAEITELRDALADLGVGASTAALDPVEWSDISLNADAHFVWSTPVRLLTYLGLGAGLHVLNGSTTAFEGTFVEDLLDTVTAGVNGIAGLEFALSQVVAQRPGKPFLALSRLGCPGRPSRLGIWGMSTFLHAAMVKNCARGVNGPGMELLCNVPAGRKVCQTMGKSTKVHRIMVRFG